MSSTVVTALRPQNVDYVLDTYRICTRRLHTTFGKLRMAKRGRGLNNGSTYRGRPLHIFLHTNELKYYESGNLEKGATPYFIPPTKPRKASRRSHPPCVDSVWRSGLCLIFFTQSGVVFCIRFLPKSL